jgi:hypothetical protein
MSNSFMYVLRKENCLDGLCGASSSARANELAERPASLMSAICNSIDKSDIKCLLIYFRLVLSFLFKISLIHSLQPLPITNNWRCSSQYDCVGLLIGGKRKTHSAQVQAGGCSPLNHVLSSLPIKEIISC